MVYINQGGIRVSLWVLKRTLADVPSPDTLPVPKKRGRDRRDHAGGPPEKTARVDEEGKEVVAPEGDSEKAPEEEEAEQKAEEPTAILEGEES